MNRKLTEATVLETGEKVIPGSLRPDGTVRKERRIRAGFVPQDEQPVYMSRGALAKQNVPTCPGMDETEVMALKQQATKTKKSSSSVSKPPNPKSVPNTLASPQADSKGAAVSKAVAADPPAQSELPSENEDPKKTLEKRILNLNKKIRQCNTLAEKKQAGVALDKEQEEKLAKSTGWQEEVRQLEEQLAKLVA
ncbi:hypothetical protein VaNZ11_003919 [Volvox africanus]|uniref:WIBG Mago-binding domain-containing protein n=1 Tax=Volvox africanus TaxID=51714 RepID=A0ABQ5RV79_9CHLO|nr:hypothetical protein VaNZ11_003919 [Volvox africanus]